MKPFINYLLSCMFLSSLQCVAMDSAEIASAYESDHEVSQTSTAKKTVNKMDIEFITHPQHTRAFKKRPYRTLRQRENTMTATTATPNTKQSVTIADVELMIDVLSRIEQDSMQQAQILPQAHPARTVAQLSKEFFIEPVARKKPHTEIVHEQLIPITVGDYEHNLAIFQSENGSRYHIRCDRCSTGKEYFISSASFTVTYCNFRRHLKRIHNLTQDQIRLEVPYRN